jgi:hypothetical protein
VSLNPIYCKSYTKRGKEERRAIGRPRVRWINSIKETKLQEKQKQEACISLDTQKGIRGMKDKIQKTK